MIKFIGNPVCTHLHPFRSGISVPAAGALVGPPAPMKPAAHEVAALMRNASAHTQADADGSVYLRLSTRQIAPG